MEESSQEGGGGEDSVSRPITHIIVAGFHHQFGPKVFYVNFFICAEVEKLK